MNPMNLNNQLIHLSITERLLLHNIDTILLIESGNLDLFYLECKKQSEKFTPEILDRAIKKNIPLSVEMIAGPLQFISSFTKGDILFPFPFANGLNRFIIAVSSEACLIRRIEIQNLIKENKENKKITHLMEKWIINLSSILSWQAVFQPDEYIYGNQEYNLEPNKKLIFPVEIPGKEHSKLIWLDIIQGALEFTEEPSITLEPDLAPFPLAPLVILKTLKPSIFKTEEKADLLNDQGWRGLIRFNELIFKAFHKQSTKNNLEQQFLLAQLSELDQQSLQNAFKDMEQLFDKEPTTINPLQPQIIQACEIIGKELKQPFTNIHENLPSNPDAQVNLVSVRSLIASRKVNLENNWWKEDSGPLLGRILEGKAWHFAALLPSPPEGYVLNIPGKGKIQVEEKIAKNISSFGYMFYRHFPQNLRKISFAKVMNFILARVNKDLITGLLATSLAVLFSLFTPIAMGIIFNKVIPSSDLPLLFQIILALIIISVSSTLFNITKEIAILRIESYSQHDIECALWQRILNLPLNFFREYSSGDLLQRLVGVNEIRKLLANHALQLGINTLFSVFNLFIMIYFSPILSVVGVGIILILFSIYTIGFLQKQKIISLSTEANAELYARNVQTVVGISKIRTFGAENRFFSKWEEIYMSIMRLGIWDGRIGIFMRLVSEMVPYLVLLALFLTIYLMDVKTFESLTFGSYVAFFTAFMNLYLSLLTFQKSMFDVIACLPIWKRSKPILEAPPESSEPKIILEKLNGEVRVEQVCFRYSSSGPLTLKDVSFYANPGEFIAIIGHSGSGKSTLIRLLLGFEEPEKGAIFFNGKDLKDLDIKAVRSKIGVVLQNSSIIQGTVRENISAGKIVNDEEIMRAIKLASFDVDLSSMPMGLNTPLTGTMGISGGQQQRIILARALVGNPTILILDEATNALDNKTQAIVSRNLDNCYLTRIVIAHRLSTIKNAHRIYMMDKGKIIQSGTYDELLKNSSLFQDFVEKQRL